MERIAYVRGIDYLRMDGKTPAAERSKIVRDFQSGKGPAVFLTVLKRWWGLNLTRQLCVPFGPVVEPRG